MLIDDLPKAHRFLAHAMADESRGGEDPADPATVQAMQIALHIPKQEPPNRIDVLTASAQAVVAVCLDPRAGRVGAWRDGLGAWYGHRIRKIARRARGAGWDNVQALPGITTTVGTAQARAFVPSAVGEVPHLISKLQIKGTELPHVAASTVTAEDIRMAEVPVICVDDSLDMSVGKAAAQVGHASMLLAAEADTEWVLRWAEAGFPLAVHEVPRDVFDAVAANSASVPVRDSGFTEVAPGSVTVVGHPGSF